MIFADASALIAIIAAEPEADRLADIIEAERLRFCSALCVWQVVAGLCRRYTFSVPAARLHAGRFLAAGKFQFVGMGEREYDIAADAYAQYGKGRHPAALNMADCYAYACAKANRAKLLFTGDNFAKTDIPAAG